MKTILLLACILCSSGCVFTKVTLPAKAGDTPGSMTRISLAGNQAVGHADLKNGTLDGYSSEQAEAAAAIASGVASGVAKALAKP